MANYYSSGSGVTDGGPTFKTATGKRTAINRQFGANSVWDIQRNAEARGESQDVDNGVIANGGNLSDRNSETPRREAITSYEGYRGGGVTALQFFPSQFRACSTSVSGGLFQLNMTGHGLAKGDCVQFLEPWTATATVIEAAPTSIVVNANSNQYVSGTTGIRFARALQIGEQGAFINGVDLHSSDGTQRDKIHELRTMRQDNIGTIIASGYQNYLGYRGLNVFADLGFYNFHTGYSRTNYYVEPGADPETRISASGYGINGQFTIHNGIAPQTRKYYGKGE